MVFYIRSVIRLPAEFTRVVPIIKKLSFVIIFIITGLFASLVIMAGGVVEATSEKPTTAYYSSSYYYSKMNDREKRVFDTLYSGLVNCEPEIILGTPDDKYEIDELKQVFNLAFNAYIPEIYHVVKRQVGLSGGYVIAVRVSYKCSKEDYNAVVAKAAALAEQIKADTIYMSVLGKEKYVINYLNKNVKPKAYYADEDDGSSSRGIDALVIGAGNCNAFSSCFMYFMRYLGLECEQVYGTLKVTGDRHAWNIIKISQKWYYVDIGWGVGTPAIGKFNVSGKTIGEYQLPSTDKDFPKISLPETPDDMFIVVSLK